MAGVVDNMAVCDCAGCAGLLACTASAGCIAWAGVFLSLWVMQHLSVYHVLLHLQCEGVKVHVSLGIMQRRHDYVRHTAHRLPCLKGFGWGA